MNIDMVNDGPVTLIIESNKDPKALKKLEMRQDREAKTELNRQKQKNASSKQSDKDAQDKKEEEKKERVEQDKIVVDEISKRLNRIQNVAVETAKKQPDDEELNKLRDENKKLQYRVQHLCKTLDNHPANKKL